MRSRQGTFTSRGAPLVPTLPAPPWPWASANIISVSITPSAQECYAGLPWWLSGKDEQIQHTSLVSTSRLVGDRGGKQELLPAWVKIRPEWFQEAFFFFFKGYLLWVWGKTSRRCVIQSEAQRLSHACWKTVKVGRGKKPLHAWGREGDTW